MPRHRAGAHKRAHYQKKLARFTRGLERAIAADVEQLIQQEQQQAQPSTSSAGHTPRALPKIINIEEGIYARRLNQTTFLIKKRNPCTSPDTKTPSSDFKAPIPSKRLIKKPKRRINPPRKTEDFEVVYECINLD